MLSAPATPELINNPCHRAHSHQPAVLVLSNELLIRNEYGLISEKLSLSAHPTVPCAGLSACTFAEAACILMLSDELVMSNEYC